MSLLRQYHHSDFKDIAAWGKQWGADYREDQFPKTGFIVPGIAAFFLYSTDSSVCYLENLIANKDVNGPERSEAIDQLVEVALATAKDMGFKVAYACTDIGQVVYRAIQAGANTKTKQVLLTKDLTQA